MKRIIALFITSSMFFLACGVISSMPTQTPLETVTPVNISPTLTFTPEIQVEMTPVCGDGSCEITEDSNRCLADCGNLVTPQFVPFPADSVGAKHEFYPLLGQHANQECQVCHTTNQYQGTSTTCLACHNNLTPLNHYTGECASCHVPDSWQLVNFDHQLVGTADCLSCHATVAPANHYTGACSSCHNTISWLPATFDHTLAGAADCLACHANDAPVNHFAGQCSTCHHSTTTWTGASYNHTFPITHGGANSNCLSCHVNTTVNWSCSTCHNDAAMVSKHKEEGMTNITNCLQCHPTGNGGEGGDD